jgi:uncharacterized protein GlcG (DUF336 family)
MPLTSEEARRAIDAAHAHAARFGIKVAVAVVDEGGLLQALARMDGAMPLSSQVAEAKASGAALTLRDGGSLAQLAQERPGFFSVADRLARVPIVPGLGSVVIRRNGAALGAIGISGGKPEQDLECAEAALKAL